RTRRARRRWGRRAGADDARARDAVQAERGRDRIGAVVPGAVEPEAGARSGTQGSVVRHVRDGHVRAGLGVATVPQLRDALPGTERPGQAPAADRTAEIGDGDVRA